MLTPLDRTAVGPTPSNTPSKDPPCSSAASRPCESWLPSKSEGTQVRLDVNQELTQLLLKSWALDQSVPALQHSPLDDLLLQRMSLVSRV